MYNYVKKNILFDVKILNFKYINKIVQMKYKYFFNDYKTQVILKGR